MENELKMTVSGVVSKDGKPNVYVVFEDGTRRAEGIVPACVIEKQTGFQEDEIKMLEFYMQQNQDTIKKMAKQLNPFKAMMK